MASMYDQDGFIRLIRKAEDKNQVQAEKHKSKRKKNPYKKGSWKYTMLKALLKHKSSKWVKDFHFTRAENILLSAGKKSRFKKFNAAITKDELEEYSGKHKDAEILIYAGDGLYSKISLSCYLALMDIDKIRISVDIKGQDDVTGETDEWFDMYEDEVVIDNINHLMEFINYHRQMDKGIMTVQAHCCWYTYVKYKVHVVVLKQDGSSEVYKGDLNDFLKVYKFTPLI